ncbi:MAG: hypothetical protein ACE5E7_13630 [Anaerolineae bacterium]
MDDVNYKTNAERLREFQVAAGAPPPPQPALPDAQTLALRQALVKEEYEEVTAAFDRLMALHQNGTATNSLADVAALVHELTDLLYVTYGSIWACGVDPDEVFAEVHRANMQKMNGPRRADGKLLKPPGWQPADVGALLERQRR